MTAAGAVLVVGPSWVGDMVMAQTLFKLLVQQRPDISLDVLAPAWAGPVLQRMPEIRRCIDMPVGHGKLQLSARRRLAQALRAEGYQQALLLPNSLKSAVVPWLARIPLRTGWRGEMRYGLVNDLRLLDERRYPLMVQRFAALALPPGAALPASLPRPELRIDAANQRALRRDLGLDPGRPLLGLCPGAEFGPAKQWPARHYGALATHYLRQGWQVVLLGSANDAGAVADILAFVPGELHGRCAAAAGRTTLVDAIDVLGLCRAVVSNDSGLMHVAAAVGSPLVAIYGSTSPTFTPPLAERVAVVHLDLDCRPCFQRSCPLGHLNCLEKLLPGRVTAALDPLLAAAEPGA